MNPKTSLLIAAIFNLARELPPAMLEALATELETSTSTVNWVNLARFGATQAAKERIHAFSDLLTNMPDLDGRAVAFAIGASAHAAAMISSEQRVEVAWTDPGTEAVLYELVEFAESEVVLVTYAAYRAERALDALHAATERGVRVMMVIELAQESGGKITFDGQDSICGRVPRANVFYWPLERRARSIAGAYGAMHVKCLIADRKTALVSSANLTDHALEMNMELGVLVRGVLPGRLAAHFDQLVLRGELVALHGGRA